MNLKLRKCKVFNDTQKMEEVRHCLHQALKRKKLDEGVRELEGKNLLLDSWFVLVHGMAHTMLGNHLGARIGGFICLAKAELQ